MGLFWTLQLPDDSVKVDLEGGTAWLRAFDVPIFDYTLTHNAVYGGGPAPVPGFTSFKVVWGGAGETVDINNTDPVYGGFAGQFIRNTAQMQWTASVGDFALVSDPLETSSSAFAEIGREQNGSFFPKG